MITKAFFVFLLIFSGASPTAAQAENSNTRAAEDTSLVSPAILIMGDSLSAGFGIDPQQGWVSLLADRVRVENLSYRIINASLSGETTAGGLARMPKLLEQWRPRMVVIELGGNDGLRGYPITSIADNLTQMIGLVRKTEALAVLIPMQIPPNYGPRYTQAFARVFHSVAADTGTRTTPFLLDRVAGFDSLMQEDGIHPRAEAQPQMLANVWPTLRELLEQPKTNPDFGLFDSEVYR